MIDLKCIKKQIMCAFNFVNIEWILIFHSISSMFSLNSIFFFLVYALLIPPHLEKL